MTAGENGGKNMRLRERKIRNIFIIICALIVEKNLVFMAIRNVSIVAITVI